MFAEVEQLALHELSRGGGDEHLATVTGRGDAGRAMDVSAHVPLVGQQRRPRVQPAPHPDLARCELPRQLLCRRERPRRGRERDEERITLRVHLDAVVVRASFADHAPMLGKRLCIGLGPELVQQLRRALDVREEEGDGAGGKVAPHRR